METTEKLPLPFELFGVECEKGWYKLIEPVYEYIKEYNKDKKEEDQICFTQIKEKWGLLRIYVNFGTKELYKLIDEAEEKSANVCEYCGSEENVGMRETVWLTTMCIDCIKEIVKKNGYPQSWRENETGKLFMVYPDGKMNEIKEEDKDNENTEIQ